MDHVKIKIDATPRPGELWIVGQIIDWSLNNWAFIGVFDSQEKAEQACVDEYYFVGPATLNKAQPHHHIPWEGLYRPKHAGNKDPDLSMYEILSRPKK